MADDLTPGEVRRTLERIERSQRDAHKAIDDRLASLAQQMVPASLWASENKALSDDVKHLETDTREAFERVERTSRERKAALETDIAVVRKAVADHQTEHRENNSWSRSKTLTVIAIVVGASATLAGAWIAAVLASRGVG